MAKSEGIPEFVKILDAAKDLHITKNADYTGGNSQFFNFGYAAAFAGVSLEEVFNVMIGVKLGRMAALRTATNINHESLESTEIDLMNYTGLMTACRQRYGEEFYKVIDFVDWTNMDLET